MNNQHISSLTPSTDDNVIWLRAKSGGGIQPPRQPSAFDTLTAKSCWRSWGSRPMPFDAAPLAPKRPRHERVVLFAVKAPDLKTVIIDAYCDDRLTSADVEILFEQYGLEHD